jgi:hypothetical protein
LGVGSARAEPTERSNRRTVQLSDGRCLRAAACGAWNSGWAIDVEQRETVGAHVRSRLLVLVLAMLASGCSSSSAADLLDERFVSVAIERDGEPIELVAGPVELDFEDRGRDDVVRWYAGCNTVGGVFDISAEQLQPRQTPDGLSEFESTAVDCPEEQHEQDDWLTNVFASAPEWTLDEDGTLQVVGDGVRLTFEPA